MRKLLKVESVKLMLWSTTIIFGLSMIENVQAVEDDGGNVVVVVGTPIPQDPIPWWWTQQSGGAGQTGGHEGGGGGSGGGSSAAETKEECEARVDELVAQCIVSYRQLTIGGGVVTCGALARVVPTVGAFCGFEIGEMTTISANWCTEQGKIKRTKECK